VHGISIPKHSEPPLHSHRGSDRAGDSHGGIPGHAAYRIRKCKYATHAMSQHTAPVVAARRAAMLPLLLLLLLAPAVAAEDGWVHGRATK
jgi:hypothetical protein